MKVMHTAFKNNIHCSLDYTGQQKEKEKFHIAEPKYNNQIALSRISVKGQGIKFKKNYVCNKKVIYWFLITIHSIK
jgi:hypothetical protein